MALITSYGLQNLKTRPVSPLLTLASALIATILVAACFSIEQSFGESVKNSASAFNTVVLRRGASLEAESRLSRSEVNEIVARAETVAQSGGNREKLVSPEFYVVQGLARRGSGELEPVGIRGFSSLLNPSDLRLKLKISSGRWFEAGKSELVVGEFVGGRIANCGLGETLQLAGRSWKIVGIASNEGGPLDGEILGEINELQKSFNMDVFHSITIRHQNVPNPAELRSFLAGHLPVNVELEQDYYQRINEDLHSKLRFELALGGGFMVLLVFLCVARATAKGMASRTHEVAILRALGFSSGQVWQALWSEVSLLVAVGCILGIFVGTALGGHISAQSLGLLSKLEFNLRMDLVFHLFPAFLVILAVGSLGASIRSYQIAFGPIQLERPPVRVSESPASGSERAATKESADRRRTAREQQALAPEPVEVAEPPQPVFHEASTRFVQTPVSVAPSLPELNWQTEDEPYAAASTAPVSSFEAPSMPEPVAEAPAAHAAPLSPIVSISSPVRHLAPSTPNELTSFGKMFQDESDAQGMLASIAEEFDVSTEPSSSNDIITEHLAWFGFKIKPFSNTPDERFFFPSSQHAQALKRVTYVVENMEGLGMVTGNMGRGKSTLARRLLSSLDQRQYESSLMVVVHSSVTPDWLLRSICKQFGVAEEGNKVQQIGALYQRLMQIYQQGRKAVVIIDEAQMLQTRELMEELRGLLNLEVPGRKLLSIILFGLESLEQCLALDEPLRHRVAVRYNLKPLDRSTLKAYIEHRTVVAGVGESLFDDESIDLIFEFSKGSPRLINTICNNSLMESYFQRTRHVSKAVVQGVCEELNLGTWGTEEK